MSAQADDEATLRAAHRAWIAAVNAADLDTLLHLLADDAVFINPGQAPFGRDRFHEGFRAGHAAFELRCESEIEELVVVGDIAYSRCRDRVTGVPRGGGAAAVFAGHRLSVYRKAAGGRWLLARDAHTVLPVAADLGPRA